MKRLVKIKTIGQFGAFKEFEWHLVDDKNKAVECKPLNFIFGRNYSGKTTLSKILQAFELGKIPEHYDGAAFELVFSDGSVMNETQIAALDVPVRVFNRDFVTENLAFLRDTRSDKDCIKSFAVLGKGSEGLEEQIQALADELGKNEEEASTGLYAEHRVLALQLEEKRKAYSTAKTQVDKLKQKIALDKKTGIKYIPVWGELNYTIAKLEKDAETVAKPDYQNPSDEEVVKLNRIARDGLRAAITAPTMPSLKLDSFRKQAEEFLRREVVSSESIEELLNDTKRADWVRKGYDLHQDDHTTCAFCGQPITDERWLKLRKHFENEAETLHTQIIGLKVEITFERKATDTWLKVDPRDYYAAYESKAKEIVSARGTALENYRACLDAIEKLLAKRLKAIATPIDDALPDDVSSQVIEVYQQIKDLAEKHNDYTAHLSEAQKKAKEALRLHHVAKAMKETGIAAMMIHLKDLLEDGQNASDAEAAKLKEIQEKSAQLADLRKRRHDESEAAKLINFYLAWMGENNKLQLEATEIEEDGVKSKVFRITRNGTAAFNLSEGECNLIAFCYFLAKLSSPELQNDKPIIWIDDPISSLDLNHIYFVYAMIRGVILGEKRYGQLFISTHNLEFLRYLMRMADWEVKPNGQEERVPIQWFFVRHSPNGSVIEGLPKYLKNYVTEFAYLFTQIYNAAEADPNDEAYEKLIYGFGNAARRFLEIYLYFKFPNDLADDKTEHTRRMSTLFGDKVRGFMVDRVINEMSHEPGAFERAMAPIDSTEVHDVACEILRKIKETDHVQYENLLKGIGKEDPLGTETVPQS